MSDKDKRRQIGYYCKEISKRDNAIRNKEKAFFSIKKALRNIANDCKVYNGIREIDFIRERIEYILDQHKTS